MPHQTIIPSQCPHTLVWFPFQDVVRAQAELAEAYATGGYPKQAKDHLARAREACGVGVHDNCQSQRLQVDLLAAEGVMHFSEEQFDKAEKILEEAARLGREVIGESDFRVARVDSLMGQLALRRKQYAKAGKHFAAARDVHEAVGSADSEEALQLRLRIAEALHGDGRREEALRQQREAVATLKEWDTSPDLLVGALSQLARWLENEGSDYDAEALKALQDAEEKVKHSLGHEDLKDLETNRDVALQAVDIKRDIALLHLKRGRHEEALQFLQSVEYLERRLHGSQSTNVGKTLKALGTVHLVRQQVAEAEQCLLQALRIFESDFPPNTAIIRDIHAKLNSIASPPRS